MVKVNFAHLPCLISLHSLCLKRDKVAIVASSLDWVWNLEKMDLLGNKIKYMEPHVFETLPHLRSLQLDSSRLIYIEPWILNSWKSLMSIILAWNLWDCGRNVCGLASWLHSFQGCYGDKSQCASRDVRAGQRHPRCRVHLLPLRGWGQVHSGHLLWAVTTTVTWAPSQSGHHTC